MTIKVHSIVLPDGRTLIVNPGTDGIFVVNKPSCVDDYGNIVPGTDRYLDTYVCGPTSGHYSAYGTTPYGDAPTPERLDPGFGAANAAMLAAEGFVTIYDYLTGRYTAIADLTEEPTWTRP